MSSPIGGNNISVIISTTQPAVTPISTQKEEKKDELASFAISTSRQEPQYSTSTSKMNFSIDLDSQPPSNFVTSSVLSVSMATSNSQFPDLEKLAKTFENVCNKGLLTLEKRSLNKDAINNVSMDQNPNISLVSLNYIADKDGIVTSLLHPSKGGLSVALERQNDPMMGRDLSDQNLLKELEERSHQTILIGLRLNKKSDNPNDLGYAKLALITKDDKVYEKDKAVDLGIKYGDMCNECWADDSIAPSNFDFILVPERLMKFIENVKTPCPIIPVKSDKYEVSFYGDEVVISCPDYQSKLKELYTESGLLTHVLKENTKNEIH